MYKVFFFLKKQIHVTVIGTARNYEQNVTEKKKNFLPRMLISLALVLDSSKTLISGCMAVIPLILCVCVLFIQFHCYFSLFKALMNYVKHLLVG